MFAFLGHEDVPVDVSYRRMEGETRVMGRIHVPRYRKAGVKFAVMATGGDQVRPFGRASIAFRTQTMGAFKFIYDMYQEAAEAPDDLMIVKEPADFDLVLNSDKVGVILHLEGGAPLEGKLYMLTIFHQLGVRSMQLGWFFRNELADSGAEPNPGGLSNFGRQVVEEMNRLGMVIDISHLAEASSLDAVRFSNHPVMASHSNAKVIRPHHRNLSDELIRAIADRGGIIGVVLCPPYVAQGQATIDDLIDHLDHIKSLTGVEHLAIGPDYFDYARELLTGEVAQKTGQSKPETRFPLDLETVEDLPNLIPALERRGYKAGEIEGIMGGNLLRLYRSII